MENRLSCILAIICASAAVVLCGKSSVDLQMTFLRKGIKAISVKQVSSLQRSLLQCVLQGLSNLQCHAVNYNPISSVCELISAHGTVLAFDNASNYTFVAFNNRQLIIERDAQQTCISRGVQWMEMWARSYVAPNNPVYADYTTKNCYVCKATVDDNELPGVVLVSEKKCKFVLHGKISFAEFYLALVLDPATYNSATWLTYDVGNILPRDAFVGGQTGEGILLFVCRALISGIYYSGYYDPNSRQASINSGSLQYPSQVELLVFKPNGPVSAPPAGQIPCPRPHVRQAYSVLEWVEHWWRDPKPPATVISGTVPITTAVGSSFITADIPAKLEYTWKFCLAYDGKVVCNQWGKILVSSVSYEWVPFTAGRSVPNNAIIGAHTVENDPLYIITKDTIRFSVGQYDPKSGQATLERHGPRHPSTMHMLTVRMCSSLNTWTDKGYNTHSGPITAMLIQYGDTVTGIKSRFGAQWSSGFWSDAPSHGTQSQLTFQGNEYVKGVEIGLGDEFHFIKVFTNLETYGPFGVFRGGSNKTMVTRCGQVEFFSGQVCWNETMKMNHTFLFNVHGQICS